MPENKKLKITYVLSNINRAVAFEWISELLDRSRFELSFVLLNKEDSYIENYLREHHVPVKRIVFRGKKDVIPTIVRLIFFFRKNKTNLVHCHLFPACLCGIIASKLAGVKRRIHTRHYSIEHQKYAPRFVKYDRLINRWSTEIIAISNNVKNTLVQLEKVNENKIHLVHHGFKLELFDKANIEFERIEKIKLKYDVASKSPVVGVSARFIHIKGIQYIIPAFKKLLVTYPNAVLILANANGDYKNEIRKLLNDIPGKNYREIKFENDLFALFHIFDVFLHVPIDAESEAYGQIYVEALAAGIPSIFTMSGIANEFVVDKKNAIVVPYQNSESITDAIKSVLSAPENYRSMIEQGKKDVNVLFSVETMMNHLATIYEG